MNQRLQFFWSLLQVDLASVFRHKAAVFWTFGFPLLSLIIFMSSFGDSGKLGPISVRFEDRDQSATSAAFVKHLQEVLKAQQAVMVNINGKDDDIITLKVPQGFAERLQARQGVIVETSLAKPKSMAADVTLSILGAVADDYALRQLYQYRGIQLSLDAPRAPAKLPFAAYLVTGLLCMVVVSTALLGFVVPLVASRQAGHYRVYALLPVSRLSVVMAFSVSKFIVIVCAGLALFGFGMLFYQLNLPLALGPWLQALLVLLLGVAGFLALGLVLAARVPNTEWATILCNVIYFPLIFLGNLFIPLDSAGPLKQVLDWMPVNLFVQALRATLIQGESILAQPWFLLEFTVLTALAIAYASRAFVLNQGMVR